MRGPLTLCLLIALLLGSLNIAAAQELPADPPVVFDLSAPAATHLVTLSQANLRAQAATSSAAISPLPKDARLTILESSVEGMQVTVNGYTSSQWLRVRTESDQEGYVWSGLVAYELTDPRLPGITIVAQPGVPDTDVNLIAAGTWTSLQYMQVKFDSTVTTTIKIYNTDRADTGEFSCCITNSVNEPGPRFMVNHRTWVGMSDLDRVISASHEMMHVWQAQAGQCLESDRRPLGLWLIEGMAEYESWNSAVEWGWVSADEMMRRALSFGGGDRFQIAGPDWFELWENPANFNHFLENNGYPWSHLAAMKLVADYGDGILASLCQEAARVGGDFKNFPLVFSRALGILTSDFYATLPDYFTSLGLEAGENAPQTAPSGCIAPTSVNLSRILIQCHGVNPFAGPAQAGFIIQPGSRFDEITEIRLPEGAEGRWEARTEVYFVRFPFRYVPGQVYTVVFVYDGVEYPFQFAF